MIDATELLEDILGKNKLMEWDREFADKMKKIAVPRIRTLCVSNMDELDMIAPFLVSSKIEDILERVGPKMEKVICFKIGKEVDMAPAKYVPCETAEGFEGRKFEETSWSEATSVVPRKNLGRCMNV